MLKRYLLASAALLVMISAFMYGVSFNQSITVSVADTEFDTVVIDAGHGGFDGGAIGLDGVLEKNINLQIALKLNDILRAGGFKTVMTRNDDSAVPNDDAVSTVTLKKDDMRKRLSIMDTTPNSIAVSIHQNTFSQSRYKGAQIFYGVNNPMSKILAESIQRSFADNLQKDNSRGIKKAQKDLFLLYFTKAPAVIVECGFLSNPEELKNLQNEDYQSKIAFTIYKGILDYKDK